MRSMQSLAPPKPSAFSALVDAINDEATSFYKEYGFVPLTDEPLTPFR
jgi:hypothetical protein